MQAFIILGALPEAVSIVSVSLPDALLRQVDALIKARGYAGRSEIVRAALRDFLTKDLQAPDAGREGPRSATLTLVYPEGHERRIGEIRHDFNEIVKSMMHAHTSEHCVEVFMLLGKAPRIREFADRLRSYRDARLVQIIFTDVEDAARAVPAAASGGHAAGRPGAR